MHGGAAGSKAAEVYCSHRQSTISGQLQLAEDGLAADGGASGELQMRMPITVAGSCGNGAEPARRGRPRVGTSPHAMAAAKPSGRFGAGCSTTWD